MLPREPSPLLGIGVAVAMLAGVSLVQLFPSLPPRAFALACLLPALVLYLRDAGRCWAGACGQAAMAQRLPAELSGRDFRVEGRVLGLPSRDEQGQRFDFRIEQAKESFLL